MDSRKVIADMQSPSVFRCNLVYFEFLSNGPFPACAAQVLARAEEMMGVFAHIEVGLFCVSLTRVLLSQ